MVSHAEFEAEEIRKYALIRNQYHDPSIPLIEKMNDWRTITIPGNSTQRKYNVLVVEDFGGSLEDRMGTIGRLSEKVEMGLEKLGKYGGTNIFSTFAIADCLEICGTGQIDAILMDGGHYLLAELPSLMDQFGGRLKMSQDFEEIEIPQMDGFGEKKMWKKMIFKEVEKNGRSSPKCLIVPSGIMEMDVSKFVDEMLTSK